MKPKGGVTLIIAVGGGKPPHHGRSNKDEEGCEMIKVPLTALAAGSEEGEDLSPEVGDSVVLENVEGELVGLDGDHAHVDLKTANGEPLEYVEHDDKEIEKDSEEDVLRAMAAEKDEEEGY
jgi:predicted dienelactone hydrolase